MSFTFRRSLAVFVSIEELFGLCRRRRCSLGLRNSYFSSDVAKSWSLNFGAKLARN